MKIIFATGNQGKIKEIKRILADINMEIISMKEAGIDVDIEENGTTFAENAMIKARTIHEALQDPSRCIVMADDSGLVIDYLNGEPGIYSARYMGEDTPYDIKNKNLIERLNGVDIPERSARFVCAIAAVLPDGQEKTAQATIEGYIGYEQKGENGFGYDPIFMVPEYNKTTAQLSEDEKNAISHRGKALRIMKEELMKTL